MSTGIRTPPHFCSGSGPSFWPVGGACCTAGRRWRSSLVPASSAVAVATTSAGAACAQSRSVIAFSSGEEKTAASPTVSSADDDERDDELLDQVVGPGREAVRVGRARRGAVPARRPRGLPAVASAGRRRDRRHVGSLRRSASIGGTTPWRRTRMTCATTSTPTTSGSSTTCHSSIWPGFSTLKYAPMPTEFRPSLAWVEIHCESKFDCDEVAGERGADRAEEGDRAGDPGQRPACRARRP